MKAIHVRQDMAL